jgi:predicted RNA-binding Zn-ribbon protein involved in translation (DUF1610 family)
MTEGLQFNLAYALGTQLLYNVTQQVSCQWISDFLSLHVKFLVYSCHEKTIIRDEINRRAGNNYADLNRPVMFTFFLLLPLVSGVIYVKLQAALIA